MKGMDLRATLGRALRPTGRTSQITELYRAHFGYVWQVLCKLGVGSGEIEDAVHDVFVVAHRRWHDFEGRSTARTWLFAIARRVAFRYRRTEHRTRRRHAALALVRPPDPVEPDALLARKRAWEALSGFLDALPPAQREAFVLGEIEGATREQMGVALRISPNTAYSRLRAARQRFVEAFPEPQQRRTVTHASAPTRRDARRRVHALLLAHPALATTPAAALLAAGLSAAAGAGLVLSLGLALGGTPAPAAPLPARSASVEAVAPPSTIPPTPVGARMVPLPPTRAQSARVPIPPPSPTRPPPLRSTITTTPEATTAAVPPALRDLSASMASLTRARRALADGQASEALRHLDDSRRLDPEDTFATERSVTRVWSLCAAHQPRQARHEMQRLLHERAASAYVAVLAESCVGDMIDARAGGDQGG